jgi:hypothetical protein
MRVAIIGTREPTEEMMILVKNVAFDLAYKGIEISTGGAKGIDTAAMIGAGLCNPNKLFIYLPKKDLRIPGNCNITVYDKKIHHNWTQSVRKYHPSKGNLPPDTFALHARNFGIVADPQKVDVVIALPKSLTDWGGTGQGMRIANDLGIKMYNLLYPGHIEEMNVWVKSFY